MVPELISHETERRLCFAAGDTSSRYAEVLSFTRLARRVADSVGSAAVECLDNGGRVAAMAAAARGLSSQIKAYAAVETKPEFLTELIDGIDEFKRCCITSEDLRRASLEAQGSLAQKLEELSLLMSAYDSLCAQGKRDPRDQMTWLLEQLEESDFAQKHVFYIDGFPDFTRQNLAIIEHLIIHSPEVTVSLNCDCIGSSLLAFEKAGATAQDLYRCASRAGIEVRIEYIPGRQDALAPMRDRLFQGAISQGMGQGIVHPRRAGTPYLACLDAAHQVRQLVQQGCRYRDICLVCSDMGTYKPIVQLVFHRFHIPVYIAGTEEILQKSVISTVLTALDTALSHFDLHQTLRYLRSALSPLDADTCDQVENYAVIWNIRGQKWVQPWRNHPEGLSGKWDNAATAALEKLNQARELAIAPLEALRQSFSDANTVCQQVEALNGFLDDLNLRQRLANLAAELDAAGNNREAQILDQLWEILMSALEQLYDTLGHTHWDSEHFVRLFRLLLSQYNVGTIPPVLDAVQVGPVSAMRCHEQRHLIILGAEEGKFPGYSGSSGILTDQERTTLREMGVPLTGGGMEGIQAEFAEIYGVFCGAVESAFLYSVDEQPSFLYKRMVTLAGGEESVDPELDLGEADAQEAATALARWNMEQAAIRLGLQEEYRQARMRQQYTLGKISSAGIRALYGSTLNLSASQVDCQAECRMSYFLKYGLRAKEREEASVNPAEFGTYVHWILEKTSRRIYELGGFHQVSLSQTLEIASEYSNAYRQSLLEVLDSERISHLLERNLQELTMIIRELWQELSQSEFQPIGFEVEFGSPSREEDPDKRPEERLAPISIPNNGMHAVLQGAVDRVDCWENGGRSFYRVVDYKTGQKDFDFCDVLNGVGLQMLLYLFVLQEEGAALLGDCPIPAGVQYFPARIPYLSMNGSETESEAKTERLKKLKREGLLLNDTQVLKAVEPEDPPHRSYTLDSSGSPKGSFATGEQFKLLKKHIFNLLGQMVEEISSGTVEPNPYTRGAEHSACRFCPYGSVCHREQVTTQRDFKAVKADEFWATVEGKEAHS